MVRCSFVYWLTAPFAGGISWLLVGLLLRFAPRIGLVDRPNARSSHTKVTPRGGGIGFVVAIALTIMGFPLLLSGFVFRLPSSILVFSHLWAVLGAALVIAAISLWDDFRSVGAGIRFLCHFGAAGVVLWAVGGFVGMEVGCWQLTADSSPLKALFIVVSALWIVGLTNVYNFMDGIDGIAGLQGVVAGVAWAVAGCLLESPFVLLLGTVFAGGCAGFLMHNWSRAKIFMGDVGSAFLGFSFAVLPLLGLATTPQSDGALAAWPGRLPWFAALVVWPFIGDGLLTFIRRALKKEKVWAAHRSHLYQRLVQCGWSHARVSLLYGLWAMGSSLLGLGYLKGNVAIGAIALAFAVVSLGGVFGFVSRMEGLTSAARSEGER